MDKIEIKEALKEVNDPLLSFKYLQRIVALDILEDYSSINAIIVRKYLDGWVKGDSYVVYMDAIDSIMNYFRKYKQKRLTKDERLYEIRRMIDICKGYIVKYDILQDYR